MKLSINPVDVKDFFAPSEKIPPQKNPEKSVRYKKNSKGKLLQKPEECPKKKINIGHIELGVKIRKILRL